jgi:protoheme IX farnesyltransferase
MTVSKVTSQGSPVTGTTEKRDWRAFFRMLSVLFKTRVVALLLLASVGGAFLAAPGWPGLGTMALLLLAGGLAASGAAGLNEFLERDPDALMARTRSRPLVVGNVRPRWALWASLGMILIPSLAVLPLNPAMAFFLIAGAVIYVGIYTLMLKPRTLLNIVIGGAAGSAAVLTGGAAAGNWQDPAVIALALLVFVWTPSHFWSLAILYRKDYERAQVPMLPVSVSTRGSAWWVLLHTGAAALIALLLFSAPQLGWAYLVPVAIVTVDMFARNVRLISQPTPPNARSLFLSSNVYLMVVLLAVCAGTVLNSLL